MTKRVSGRLAEVMGMYALGVSNMVGVKKIKTEYEIPDEDVQEKKAAARKLIKKAKKVSFGLLNSGLEDMEVDEDSDESRDEDKAT